MSQSLSVKVKVSSLIKALEQARLEREKRFHAQELEEATHLHRKTTFPISFSVGQTSSSWTLPQSRLCQP